MQAPRAQAELLYQSARTRVIREPSGPYGPVIRKELRGSTGWRRLQHELTVLRRLAGIEGVPRLARDQLVDGGLLLVDTGARSLLEFAGGEPLPPWLVVDLGTAAAGILAEIHQRGVIHNDINPANLVIKGEPPQLTVVDFDLAATGVEERSDFAHENTITGTLPYLAPEQTGRTGWSVDERTDLYALGATLYELATGAPPFRTGEPLQLIHDHLTRTPANPVALVPDLPPGLSAILLRLLAKEPDRRYQSAAGLGYDLQRLKAELAAGNGEAFPLGERDFSRRLVPASRPVGRDAEIDQLAAAFADASAGEGVTLLIAGEPGVGKTTLIDELRPLVAGARGWFVSGAFDEHRRDRKADAGWQALRGLCQLLLAMPEAELADQRRRIRERLGPNAGLLVSILPDLGALLGLEPVEPADTDEAQNRLVRAGLDLLRAVASPKRPLVMVLDDLQWAGTTTLALIDAVVTDPPDSLLLVGAYRETDLDPLRRLRGLLARWERLGVGPRSLHLRNLPTPVVRTMLGQMLRMPPDEIGSLADAVEARTGGNPFDSIELVNALRRDGVLTIRGARWTWDITEVHRYVGRGDVVDLLGDRIWQLPAPSQQVLRVMAAVGGRLEAELLEIASGRSPEQLSEQLEPALADGLLVAETGGQSVVRFRHARVREAVLATMAEEERPQLHREIGRRLAVHPELRPLAAEQYLHAIKTVTDPAEQRLAAELFLSTADVNRLISPVMADQLLAAAVELFTGILRSDPTVASQLAEVERRRYVSLCGLGRFDEADTLFADILEHSPGPVALAGVFRSRINSLRARDRQGEALSFGLSLLAQLGLAVPAESDLPSAIEQGYAALVAWTAEGGQEADVRRPEPTDPVLTVVAEVINEILPVSYFAGHPTFAWMMLEARRLWAQHGPSRALVGPIAHAAFVTIVLQADYRTGYEAARRAVTVGEARGFLDEAASARFLFSLSAGCWFEPLVANLERARGATEYSRYHGLPNSAISYFAILPSALDCDPTVDNFLADSEQALAVARRSGDLHTAGAYVGYRQLALALQGETTRPGSLTDDVVDFDHHLASLAASPTAAGNAHAVSAVAAAIFDRTDALIAHAAAATALMPYFEGTYLTATVHLLQALALAELASRADGVDRSKALSEFDREREWLARRAADAPHTFGYHLRWLDAERAAATGDQWRASAEYDAAIQEVARRERPWHRALITERAGRFLVGQGLHHGGRSLLSQARRLYADWGATGKVDQLDRSHPFLRDAILDQRTSTGGSISMSVSSETIDLLAVLGAARALSSATSLDRLRQQIADVLSAMTGATWINLLMWDDSVQEWRLPDEPSELPPELVDGGARESDVPITVVRYVQRTLEPLLVEDAVTDDRFRDDPHLSRMACCSLLAVPIMSRGAPLALLLLERPDSHGAFTSDRLDSLLLVAGQLAVSIENAAVYSSLEAMVDQRTQALTAANARLEQLNQTDPLTGLANRRRLEEVLTAEWNRGRALRAPVGLAMVDIDHFKLFNDAYGHPAGDECLRRVAAALADSARAGDLVARYGGEEFAVVLPGADLAAASQVAERIRLSVADLREPHRTGPLGFVTVSVGVAVAPPEQPGYPDQPGSPHQPGSPEQPGYPDQLIADADQALYAAKRGGRNRVGGNPHDPAGRVPGNTAGWRAARGMDQASPGAHHRHRP